MRQSMKMKGSIMILLIAVIPLTLVTSFSSTSGLFATNQRGYHYRQQQQQQQEQTRRFGSSVLFAVPTVDNWQVNWRGGIVGIVKNHPTLDDGDEINTSKLVNVNAAKPFAVVQTASGSKYKLANKKGTSSAASAAVGAKAKKKQPAKPVAVIPFRPSAKIPPTKKQPQKQQRGLFSSSSSSKQLQQQRQKKKQQQRPSKPVAIKKPVPKKVIEKKVVSNNSKPKKTVDSSQLIGGRYQLTGPSQRSTSGKSTIWTAKDANDNNNNNLLAIKISPNLDRLDRESENYRRITFLRPNNGGFVKMYSYHKPAATSKQFASQSALVLQKGDLDIRALIRKNKKPLSGPSLKAAASAALNCLSSIHGAGLVWTDLKTENIIAVDSSGRSFVGIDLESAMPRGGNPVDYSPEACPPEFADALSRGQGSNFRLDPSYDVWSLGTFLYEAAVGQVPAISKATPTQMAKMAAMDYRVDVSAIKDAALGKVVQSCLAPDPRKRPSVAQLKLNPYFLF